MTGFDRVILIVNPVSGQARGLKLGKQLRQSLEEKGVVCSVRVTNGPGDAERWSQTASEFGFEAVVVIGGDGTVSEAVAGQARTSNKVPLAIVPVGTANVVAIALALPLFPTMIKSNILDGRILPFDVGYVPGEDLHFLLMAALGYPAKITKDSPRRLKNLFGVFSYVMAGFRNAFKLDEVDISIEEKDGTLHRFVGNTILLANIGKIGDINLKVNPETSAHDGKFDVTVISSRSLWQLFLVIFRMLTWRFQTKPRMENFQSNHVIIRTDPPVDVQIDGENIGKTPLEAIILPHGVKIIVGQRYKEEV
jgi:diacylglycerol kinase (ATP)